MVMQIKLIVVVVEIASRGRTECNSVGNFEHDLGKTYSPVVFNSAKITTLRYANQIILGQPGFVRGSHEFKSPITLVNSQLDCCRPVGMLNPVICLFWLFLLEDFFQGRSGLCVCVWVVCVCVCVCVGGGGGGGGHYRECRSL